MAPEQSAPVKTVAELVAYLRDHVTAIEHQVERIFTSSASSDAQRAVEAIRPHLAETRDLLDHVEQAGAPAGGDQVEAEEPAAGGE